MLKKIPTSVIRNAKGLAIFTTMRTGFWVSGASGSGVLIAKKDDGSWSPPSGILLHTAGLGFMVGVDIYDCVVVINSEKALEAFYNVRCTLGSEVSVAAGPVGAGGVLDTEVHKRQSPIFTYMKSRGFYAGVQIDGTIVIERTDENERFYGERIGVKDILNGKVRHPPLEIRRLLETIKAAQGDADVDESFLPSEPPPGDYEVDDGTVFGVPDREDPDPYGVLALEKEGMGLREAGTKERASWVDFSFNPSPTSPVYKAYSRTSSERPRSEISHRSSWRISTQSSTNLAERAQPKTPSSLRASMDRPATLMTDTSTQTDDLPDPPSSYRQSRCSSTHTLHSRQSSKSSLVSGHTSPPMQGVPENSVLDTASPVRKEPESANGHLTPPRTPPATQPNFPQNDTNPSATTNAADSHATNNDLDDDLDDDDAHIEEPIVHSIQTVQPASPQVISKARLVTVQKRAPPRLPPRNPNRKVVDASPTRSKRGAGSEPGSPTKEAAPSTPALSTTGLQPPAEKDLDLAKGMESIELQDNEKTKEDPEEEEEDGDLAARDPGAKVKEDEQKRESWKVPGGFEEN